MAEKEKTYFELLQEQAEQAKQAGNTQGPELGVGPHRFTIIGGKTGTTKDKRDWSALVARHTNGHEYFLFYNLYWPLKNGEIQPQLNVDVFNWIVGFNPTALSNYSEENFNKYFNDLVGRQFEINYSMSKRGKIFIDFKTLPFEVGLIPEEEEVEVDEINFDDIE